MVYFNQIDFMDVVVVVMLVEDVNIGILLKLYDLGFVIFIFVVVMVEQVVFVEYLFFIKGVIIFGEVNKVFYNVQVEVVVSEY